MATATFRDDLVANNVPDTQIVDAFPTTNYGTNAEMGVGYLSKATAIYRFLLFINLNDEIPAGATINSATLDLYIKTATSPGYSTRFYRCTRTDWVEGEVTWNNYKTGNAWTSGGGDVDLFTSVTDTSPTSTGTWSIDILTLVSDAWSSRSGLLSILVSRVTEGSDQLTEVRSGEWSTAAQRPILTVDYTPGGIAVLRRRRGMILVPQLFKGWKQ